MNTFTKNRYLSFIVIIVASSLAQPIIAQSKLGFNIGRSYSKFHVHNDGVLEFFELSPDFDHKGFLASILYSYHFGKYFNINPSIGYIKRGTIVTRDQGIFGFHKFSLNYINFSLSAGVSPFKFINIKSGIGTNYLINAINYWDIDKSVKTTEFYNRWDIGLKSEAIVTVKNFFISAGYFHSLMYAREIGLSIPVPGNPVNEKNGYRNRSFEFAVGYMFNLKKKEK
jgi:hypothetical protein